MMNKLSRREVLAWPAVAAGAPTGLKQGNLESLAERIRTTPHGDVFDMAAEVIRNGVDQQTLLGAVFLAGIHDIRPWHVGGKLHAVMMVASALELAETAPPEEAWLAALWNLDDFKRAQEADRREGDWELPPRPDVPATSEPAAREEFLAAMDAWDPERVDRAIVALLPHHGRESLFEILWPVAARCYVNIGHKMIYAAQTDRTLRRIGWRYAEPAVRSLVYALLFTGSGKPQTAAYERSTELAPRLSERWLDGNEDPVLSGILQAELRGLNASQAQDLVLGAILEGVGPARTWDGLRLFASELFSRRTSSDASERTALLPVHAVTVTHAFGHAWRTTRIDGTKRILLLQAAAWLASLEKDLSRIVGLAPRSPTLEAPAKLTELRRSLVHGAVDHHQFKYAAAIQEESRRVHPLWASHILAPAVPYLPAAAETGSEVLERSLRALKKADV